LRYLEMKKNKINGITKHKVDALFVHNYYEQHFGIMQISAVLKENQFTTDIAIGPRDYILKRVLAQNPKIVGFYCTTGFHHKNMATALEIKKSLGNKILTVFGGPHPTFAPEIIDSKAVDIVCRGEGEYALLELMQALNSGKDYTGIQNLIVKKDNNIYKNDIRPLCDIEKLPHPDREIYKDIEYIYMNKKQEIILGRGCPFSCTFCSNHAFRELFKGKGPYVRLRSIPRVMDELRNVKTRIKPSCFFLHDETFMLNKDYCSEFLNTYKKDINLPYGCLTRADIIAEELIRLLKDTGCFFVTLGIESGNENMRNKLLKKNLSNEKILNCAKLLHKYKIPFSTFNMVGLPGESLNEAWQTVDINVRAKPMWAWFSVYQTLPETELAHYAVKRGFLENANVSEKDATFHETSMLLRNHPDGIKITRIKNIANIMIKLPLLKIIVKKILINLPADKIYALIDKALFFIFYYSRLTYKQGFFRTIKSGFSVVRRLKEFS